MAAVALRGRHVALHPAAGARLVHLYRRISLPNLHRDDRDSFVLLTGGLGLVIGDRITVRPGFSVPFGIVQDYSAERFAVPFGREERELSFDISVGVNFGRRERR